MKRLIWIDDCKAIAIFLVILAHTQICGSVTDWISVFHMPLFFFISGYLFSFQRNPDARSFIKKRFRQLVVPYIFINLITYLFWLLVSRHYGVSPTEESIAWYQPLQAALLCYGKGMVHNIPLWFLLCLFIVEVIYYYLYKPLSHWQRWGVTVIFGLLGYINYQFIPFVLPFSLGTAFVAMIFYFLGNEMKTSLEKLQLSVLLQLILLFVSVIVVTYFSITNERIYLYFNQYGNYLFFLIAAISGICMTYILCHFFANWLGKNKVIEYISRYTLTICGFHLMTYTLLKGVAVYIIGIQLEVFNETILPNVVLAVTGMAVCCLIAAILNKFFPFILGK